MYMYMYIYTHRYFICTCIYLYIHIECHVFTYFKQSPTSELRSIPRVTDPRHMDASTFAFLMFERPTHGALVSSQTLDPCLICLLTATHALRPAESSHIEQQSKDSQCAPDVPIKVPMLTFLRCYIPKGSKLLYMR